LLNGSFATFGELVSSFGSSGAISLGKHALQIIQESKYSAYSSSILSSFTQILPESPILQSCFPNMKMTGEHRVIIGIDFGTTYTG